MPLKTPAGPLTLFDEVVIAAGKPGAAPLEERYPAPVLLVDAPQDPWAEVTVAKPGERPAAAEASVESTEPNRLKSSGRPGTRVVVPVAASKYSANARRIAVGRSSVCDLILPFAAVSKVHAYLTEAGLDTWQIEDAGSTNGTMVEDLEVGTGKIMPLPDRARVNFGGVRAVFYLGASFCDEVRRLAGLKK